MPDTQEDYARQCVNALTVGITRSGLSDAAEGMPHRSGSSKREIAAWLVKYRPSAVTDLLGWDPPNA